MNNRQRTIVLPPQIECVCELERFILELTEIPVPVRNRMVITASEIFDNIISHSKRLSGSIRIKAFYDSSIRLLFVFHSHNFEMFIVNPDELKVYYDSKTRRYRGMGLMMCYNLSSAIHYRMTYKYNAILIRF